MARIGIDARMYSTRFTGIGQYTSQLIGNLQDLHDDNEYIIFLGPTEYAQVDFKNKRFTKRMTSAKHYSVEEQTIFLSQINKENLDLMHFTHFNVPIRYSRPFVVTIHDLTLHMFEGQNHRSFLKKMAYKFTINNAAKKSEEIIAVSQNTKKDIEKYLGVNPKKIISIYEAASSKFKPNHDSAIVEKIKKEYSIKSPFFLYTGVWRNHKNIPILVSAFEKFCTNYPSADYQLVIAGKGDSSYTEVHEAIRMSKFKNKIITPGFVPESYIAPLTASAFAYTFPSLYEGFGLPVLEAMNSSVPVISSNSSSLPEIAGGSSLLFDPTSTKELSDIMGQLHLNPKLRESLVEKGLVRAKEFSWKKMAEETLLVYLKNI